MKKYFSIIALMIISVLFAQEDASEYYYRDTEEESDVEEDKWPDLYQPYEQERLREENRKYSPDDPFYEGPSKASPRPKYEPERHDRP